MKALASAAVVATACAMLGEHAWAQAQPPPFPSELMKWCTEAADTSAGPDDTGVFRGRWVLRSRQPVSDAAAGGAVSTKDPDPGDSTVYSAPISGTGSDKSGRPFFPAK